MDGSGSDDRGSTESMAKEAKYRVGSQGKVMLSTKKWVLLSWGDKEGTRPSAMQRRRATTKDSKQQYRQLFEA